MKKHILITGGHSGIGYELTRKLLQIEEVQLGLVLRSKERKESLPEELLEAPAIHFFYADLSDQNSVSELANSVQATWDKLDILFNNAGVLLDTFYRSKQGNEMHLEVNTLAPYLLALGLKPLFEKASNPIIVNTVTGGLHRKKSIKLEVFEREEAFAKLFGPYLESKLALTLLSEDLGKKIPGSRIMNVNPGPNKTKMTADSGMPGWLLPIRNLLFPHPRKGAELLYQAAFDEAHHQEKWSYISGNKIAKLKYRLSDAEKNTLMNALA